MSDVNRELDDAATRWHVTKGIPLSLILAIATFGLGQIMAVMYWAAGVSTRLSAVEEYMKVTQPQAAQIAVINEKLTTLQGAVGRLEGWLHQNVPPKNEVRP